MRALSIQVREQVKLTVGDGVSKGNLLGLKLVGCNIYYYIKRVRCALSNNTMNHVNTIITTVICSYLISRRQNMFVRGRSDRARGGVLLYDLDKERERERESMCMCELDVPKGC